MTPFARRRANRVAPPPGAPTDGSGRSSAGRIAPPRAPAAAPEGAARGATRVPSPVLKPTHNGPIRATPAGESPESPRRAAARAGRRTAALLVALSIALAVASILAVGVGPVAVAPDTVARVIGGQLGWVAPGGWTPAEHSIVWLIRLPRVLLAIFVGAALAVSGVAIQAIVRNPLADPYLLGISSGASAGAAASILFGVGGALGALALTGSAFLGALLAIGLVLAIARIGGRLITSRLVFAGIAVGFALTALTNFLVFASASRDGARAVLFWMLGSLSQARWGSVPVLAIVVLAAILVLTAWSRRFDALAIGDDTALALGTDPHRFRARAALLVGLTVAAAVAVSGLIGFVGLVVPHIARRLVGGRHRVVFAAAALLGALLLVVADALARIAFAPRELPLGILTALIGTPLLIALVRRAFGR